jgi:hypothetical protein
MLFSELRIQLVGKIANREQLIAQLKDNGATILEEPTEFTPESDKDVVYIMDTFSGVSQARQRRSEGRSTVLVTTDTHRDYMEDSVMNVQYETVISTSTSHNIHHFVR